MYIILLKLISLHIQYETSCGFQPHPQEYILSVYSPFSDMIAAALATLPIANINSCILEVSCKLHIDYVQY